VYFVQAENETGRELRSSEKTEPGSRYALYSNNQQRIKDWQAFLLSACITSRSFKNEDTAKSDSFGDFCDFFETMGANVTSFLWKGCQLQKRLEPMRYRVAYSKKS